MHSETLIFSDMDKKINPSVYLGVLTIQATKPFADSGQILFTTGEDKITPTQWTVLLGNNNTGKTRLLRTIATTLNVIKNDKQRVSESFDKWITKEAAKIIFDKPELDLSSPLKPSVYEDAWASAKSKLSTIGTVMGGTISRDQVLTSLGEGQYKVDFSIKDLEENEAFYLEVNDCKYFLATSHNEKPFIVGYGVNRRSSPSDLSNSQNEDPVASLFSENVSLLNVEDWLIQTDYASKNGVPEAVSVMEKIRLILTGGILPDVKDFKLTSIKDRSGVKSYAEFLTDYGWTSFNQLGYGYQASITWLLDLAKRMLDQYPDAPNPLIMPAIVLIDEIDLHLHPSWQRKIFGHLSNLFPNTQFIVTAHSPLVIQSSDEINLILLRKEEDHIYISQPDISNYKGWSVEEILSEVMGLEEKTYSDTYLDLMKEFDDSLDNEDYEKAKHIYEQLNIILPPDSGQRKLLRIQMASLTPAH